MAAKKKYGSDFRNIVFMGMGEPFDNFSNIVQSIRVMSDQRGLDISKRHITISTVGIPRGIQSFRDLNWPQVKLAISLNAPNDNIRSKIMPYNKSFSMKRLQKELLAFPLKKKHFLFIEYVLIRGVNDKKQHAVQLADYLRPLKVKLNLIPFNPGSNTSLLPPSKEEFERFHNYLIKEKVFVRRRAPKGQNIMAACGQLKPNPDFS